MPETIPSKAIADMLIEHWNTIYYTNARFNVFGSPYSGNVEQEEYQYFERDVDSDGLTIIIRVETGENIDNHQLIYNPNDENKEPYDIIKNEMHDDDDPIMGTDYDYYSYTLTDMFDGNIELNAGDSPSIVDINEEEGRQIRQEQLSLADLVLVKVDIPALEETPIGSWVYGNRITKFIVEIWTEENRQHLYNMMGEVRRIVHNQMHSLDAYQRIRFANFNEYTDDNMNIWAGRIMIEGINNAVILEGRDRPYAS